MTSTAKTYCRVCASHCGTVVEVDGDRVLSVRGDVDHPLTAGYTCSKGRALPEWHHGSDRLLYPLVRRQGEMQRTGWTEALDDLGDKLSRIIAESGPQSIGTFMGGGGYLDAGANLLARTVPQILKTPQIYSDLTIDVISKVIVPELMMGIGGMMTRPDYERCRLVIYIGTNPAVSHGHTAMLANPTASLRRLKAQGEVWVIDPRRSETATKATRHLAPRAGTDHAVLAYLVREILRDGADRDYLARHTQDQARLAAAVEPYTLDRAVAASGLTTDELVALLAAIRKAGRLCIDTGTGLSMALSANVTQWLSWALMVITGSLDREGGAWISPGFLKSIDRVEITPAPPEGRRPPGPKSRPELRAVLGEYPSAAIVSEIEAGNLRAILNFSGNLSACLPGTNRTIAALRKLDVLATVEIVHTATVDLSTHAFPSKDQLERADLPLAVDMALPEIASQHTDPVVAPLGEARSYWWILAQIGKRIGLDFLPGLDPDTASDDDVLARIAANGRMPLDALRGKGYVVAEGPVFGWIERAVGRIGGWRLAPQELVEQLAALPAEPAAPLVLLCRRQARHVNSKMTTGSETPALYVSAADAIAAGVADGSPALVRSPHGTLEGRVRIDPTIAAGVMSVPHGWTGRHNVNHLTSPDDVDLLTGMPRLSGLPVTLHKLVDANVAGGPRETADA